MVASALQSACDDRVGHVARAINVDTVELRVVIEVEDGIDRRRVVLDDTLAPFETTSSRFEVDVDCHFVVTAYAGGAAVATTSAGYLDPTNPSSPAAFAIHRRQLTSL